MATELIITEKPQAAKKIASALSKNSDNKENIGGVPFYTFINDKGDKVLVGCAVGHLFNLTEKEEGKGKNKWVYPVFDVEWEASHKINKASSYTKKYVSALGDLAKKADKFTIACDYDIEGEVIGYNVLRFICKKKDARRMKFSTLTTDELQKSYKNVSPTINWGMANAGTTRHVLDWFYGINLSRALTLAAKNSGYMKVLSSGRVQGPALKIIVDKEKSIREFVPTPYWQIELKGDINADKNKAVVAMHKEDKFVEEEKATKAFNNIKKSSKEYHDGTIKSITKNSFQQEPPNPFDLTTLQIEAFRVFKIQPKNTLEIAQELYIAGVISYPRTSSQQYPESIEYKNILEMFKNNPNYKERVAKLLAKKDLKPNNGKKTDPAHPAIYPTGFSSKDDLDGRKEKIYDLIVARFLATFSDPATRETVTYEIDVNKEIFITKGTRTTIPGWHLFYKPYVKLEEEEMPAAKEKDSVKVKSATLDRKETKPPKRYTQASIIKELEKRGLGTKATRATIVEALYNRGYVTGDQPEATTLGMDICNILEKYSPEILDEELTRFFEEEMDLIQEEKKTPDEVLEEAKETLNKILTKFKKKEKEIGADITGAIKTTTKELNMIGKCPNCKDGDLVVRKGKFGRFAACEKYPDCKTTFSLPKMGIIKPTEELCEHCKVPIVEITSGRNKTKSCVNMACPGKVGNDANGEPEKVYKEEGMICPTCNTGKMVLRKSFYGTFLGCNNYPKCRTMMKVVDGKVDTTPIVTAEKKAVPKKKAASKKEAGFLEESVSAKAGTATAKKKAVSSVKKKVVKKTVKK